MSHRLDAMLANELERNGALEPARMGGGKAPKPTPSPPADDPVFQEAMASYRRSAQVQVVVLSLLHLAFLAILIGLLLRIGVARSDTLVASILGGTSVAAMGLIPLRLQGLWKDLSTLKLLPALLKGQPAKEQLDLLKVVYLTAKSGGGA